MMTWMMCGCVMCGLMFITLGAVSFKADATENASYYQTVCNVTKCESYEGRSNFLTVQSYQPYTHTELFGTFNDCDAYHPGYQVICYVNPRKLRLELPHDNTGNIVVMVMGVVFISGAAALLSALIITCLRPSLIAGDPDC